MCITINHANLSKTKILSLSLENGNHFIAYSNKVKNESGKPNAMILPIPGETNPSMFHNTESYKGFMHEITKKCDFVEDYLGQRSRGLKSKSLSFEKFELGMYTVGLAKEFAGIREFLNQLSEEKRPEISEELKKFFEEKYAGWHFAVCVFDSDKTIEAQPIAFEYKPFGKNLLYFPTMDGHDGKAPRVGAMVKTDHTLIYEHTGKMTDKYYAQQHVTLEEKVPSFLQNRKYRAVFSRGLELNGDTFVNIDTMNESEFKNDPEFKRIAPVPNVVEKVEPVIENKNDKTFYGIAREIRKFKWGGFVILETFKGQYQCVLKNLDVASIKPESHVKFIGEEVSANVKKELTISDREINVSSFEILSEPSEVPGINIYEKDINADVHLIFDKRALTLRNEKNKCIFKIQSYIHNAFRNYLTFNGFYSISTPKLVANGAEGGTNVFELDYFGKKAYLAQSPQLYKQMVCGALGKVFETAPVFRAEKHNSSRHLNEYLSLDLEMILEKNFYELIELEKDLLYSIFYDIQRKMTKEFAYLGIDQFPESANPKKALVLKVSEIKAILYTEGYDLSADEEKAIAKYALEKHGTEFVFATHFHKSVRPFYTKLSPDGITTESFDLIYKGVEITSGGQRSEKYKEYTDAIAAAGMSQETFEGYLDAFKYGMPLHGGLALGLERLTAKICNMDSVKAATLFPRDVDRLTP